MIELKSGVITTPHNEGMSFDRGSDAIAVTEGETEFYLKSEADKVIAELKEGAKNLILDNYLQDKGIRHQKYKRCLAMAKWCRLHDEFTQLESERLGLPQRAIFMEYRRKAMWWNKWHKRWLELAEQFKEKK